MKKRDAVWWFIVILCVLLGAFVITKISYGMATDLRNFLSDVEIEAPTDEYGHYLINPNNEYNITLAFSEDENTQFSNEDVLFYDFPAGILIGDFETSCFDIKITDDDGVAYVSNNTFSVTDNRLFVRFNQDDPNFPRLTSAANAKFEVSFSSHFDQQYEKIIFSPLIIREFIYEEIADLTITKNVRYDMDHDTAWYHVQIVSEGSHQNVIIEDTLLGTALRFNQDVSVESNLQGAISPVVDYSSIENGFRAVIPSLGNKEILTLTYSARVDNSKITGNGTVQETNNLVRTISDQIPEWKEAEADFSRQVTFHKITKAAIGNPVQHEDGTYVEWEVLVNQDHKLNIGGETIYDWADSFSRFSGNGIRVEVTFEDGSTEIRDISWEDLNTVIDDFGIYSWSYTTPVSDGNASYRIVCTSIVDPSGAYGDLTIRNRAIIFGNTADASVVIGNTGTNVIEPVKKALSDKQYETEWEIVVSVPGLGLPNFRIVDDLPMLSYHGETFIDRMIEDSLQVEGLLPGESYRFLLSISERTFTITFYANEEHTQTGLLPTENGSPRNIVVRYRTSVNQDWLNLAEESNYTTYQVHVNNMTARVGNYSVPANAHVIPVKQKIEKESTEIEYKVIDGVTYPIFRYCLTLLGITEDWEIINDFFDTSYFSLNESEGVRIYGGNTLSPNDPDGIISAVNTENGLLITVDSFPKPSENTFYKVYKIYYSLTVTDPEKINQLNQYAGENGGYTLTDFAQLENIFSNEVKVEYTYFPYVDKELVISPDTENGYVAQFRIVINKNEEDLDPEGNTLIVLDALSSNLRFIPDSVSWNPSEIDITVQYESEINTIVFSNIPDEKIVEILYSVSILGIGEVPYSNTVHLGKYERTIEEIIVIESAGGGSASNPSIKLVKRDSDNLSHTLPGAVFQLYRMADTVLIPIEDRDGNAVTFMTGQDGSVLIVGNVGTLGWTLWPDRMYCLVETIAPVGYVLNTNPNCFVLSEHPINQMQYKITGEQLNISNEPDKISISTNTPEVTPTIEYTETPLPTDTVVPTNTMISTNTSEPTITQTSTVIPYITDTPVPTATDISTNTPVPTNIPVPTKTPKPHIPPFFKLDGELPCTGLSGRNESQKQVNKIYNTYSSLSMMLEIPQINISSEIVYVEFSGDRYYVEDLGMNSGLLSGTGFPGSGNTVIAAHNTLDETTYGPFSMILLLVPGDRFFISSADGTLLIYEVYANEKISDTDYSGLYHFASMYESTVTLLTCEDERINGGYESRRIVCARQIN